MRPRRRRGHGHGEARRRQRRGGVRRGPRCHGLWTPADLYTLAFSGALVLPSVYVKTLGVRDYSSRSCTSTSGCASPLRATGCSVYASPALFAAIKATPPRTQTRYGGWLALTRRGLSPRKKRRAYLGATTIKIQQSGNQQIQIDSTLAYLIPFNESLFYELRLVLHDQAGCALRHTIAHGLAEADAYFPFLSSCRIRCSCC